MNLKKWNYIELAINILIVIGLIFLIYLSAKDIGRKVPYPQVPTNQTQLEDNFRDYCTGNGGQLSSFNSTVKDNTLVLQCGKLGKIEVPLIPYMTE